MPALVPDLDMADELLQLEGFDFPDFFDDLKKLEPVDPQQRGPGPEFDKM